MEVEEKFEALDNDFSIRMELEYSVSELRLLIGQLSGKNPLPAANVSTRRL